MAVKGQTVGAESPAARRLSQKVAFCICASQREEDTGSLATVQGAATQRFKVENRA